jgi:hypothetical protein
MSVELQMAMAFILTSTSSLPILGFGASLTTILFGAWKTMAFKAIPVSTV